MKFQFLPKEFLQLKIYLVEDSFEGKIGQFKRDHQKQFLVKTIFGHVLCYVLLCEGSEEKSRRHF